MSEEPASVAGETAPLKSFEIVKFVIKGVPFTNAPKGGISPLQRLNTVMASLDKVPTGNVE